MATAVAPPPPIGCRFYFLLSIFDLLHERRGLQQYFLAFGIRYDIIQPINYGHAVRLVIVRDTRFGGIRVVDILIYI